MTIADTGASLLESADSLVGATDIEITTATVEQAAEIVGWDGYDFKIDKIADSASALLGGDSVLDDADAIYLTGTDNEVTVDELSDLITLIGGDNGDLNAADLNIDVGATLVVVDTWAHINDAIDNLQILGSFSDTAGGFLSIELAEGESVEISMTDYAASDKVLSLLVGSPSVSVTIADDDELDLFNALNVNDAALAKIIGASAAADTDAITIDLSARTKGFSLTGGAGADVIKGGKGANTLAGGAGNDSITGGAGADSITGGAGNDTINGFVGADTVVGGAGTADELILAAGANVDLAAALDAALTEVEKVTGAATASTINLSKQTEGFTITGGAGNDVITGGAAANTIVSGDGDNTITGGAGADSITGGAGNDTIIGFVGADTVDGGGGTVDTLVLTGSIMAATEDQLVSVEVISAAAMTAATAINLTSQTEAFKILGSAGGNTITGGTGNDTITGGAAADSITGGDGNDSITGGAGADVFTGFVGTDRIVGGDGNDTLVLLSGANADLAAALDTDITTVEIVTGAATATTINLSAQLEAFTINGGDGADSITGGAGKDTITGGGGNDSIAGGVGADSMSGGAGNDQFTGFTLGDSLDGGGDTDTLLLSAGANADLAAALDTALTAVEKITAADTATTINLSKQLEGFTITGGAGNDVITGGAGKDSISGGTGTDTINGFAGADSIDGGEGAADTLVLLAGANTDLANASEAALVNLEIITGAATAATTINLGKQGEAFTINGGSAADTITGGAGNDTIDGGAGADLVTGGAGNDTIKGFVGADTVMGGDGTADELVLLAGVNSDLAAALDASLTKVEKVTAASAATTINLSKQTEGFTITGGAGNDVITGGAAANIIAGGDGDDTITGGAGADSITGGAGNDTIIDFVGADTIDGGAGTADTLVLKGSITISNDSQLVSMEVISAATLTGATTINLTGQSDSENFKIIGSAGANTIVSVGGNDTITGGAAADTITGGAGNDSITGGAGADVFNSFVGTDTIVGGDGIDTLVLAAGDNADLALALDGAIATLETVTAAAAAATTINLSRQLEGFTINGGSAADVITGGAGKDTINAGAGDDTINGFVGADTIVGGDGTADELKLSSGANADLAAALDTALITLEKITGDSTAATTINLSKQTEAFTITGGSGADVITGGAGNDTIAGGLGADLIKGGAGADYITGGGTDANTFDYTTLTNSLVASFDTIADFKAADKFKIGHTIASVDNVKALTVSTSSALATDLASSTRAASFVANGATVVTVAAGSASGRYLVINDATAAFNASTDAVIKLSGSEAVANTNFIA